MAEHLERLGFAHAVARAKASMFQAAAEALVVRGVGGEEHWRAYSVPGRIEILGKHTDYAGGSSMVAAVERAFCVVSSPRADSVVRVIDATRDREAGFLIGPELSPTVGHWSNYPMTVARRIARNFPGSDRGADIAFANDVPAAAGMSSSSAFMIGVFFALADANDVWRHPRYPKELDDRINLAGYLGTVENGQSYGALEGDRGVGTFGGSEDHTAILCSRAGQASQYAYCPIRFERAIPIPSGYTFAIASSGVVAKKTGGALEKYNRASRLAEEVTALWRQHTGRDDAHLAAALRSGPTAATELRGILASVADEAKAGELSRRLEHFIVENEQVIRGAGDALAQGDLTRFGAWVDRSQQATEELLRNQVPETVFLAAAARECGAVAASAFGGGFGGSVWALVAMDALERFLDGWRQAYQRRFPGVASASRFFASAASRPMFRLV